jgi:hypothetical protein
MAAVVQAEQVVFEMEDNYQKQSYRNRAYIAHANGRLLLNAPIKHIKGGVKQPYKDVEVENSLLWQSHHWKSLESAYSTSPYFEFYKDDLHPLFTTPFKNLMQHNLKGFKLICELVGIEVETSFTKEYLKSPEQKDLRHLITAKGRPFPTFEKYTQVLEANHGFIPNLSIIDLLFNEGPNTITYLESLELI